MLAHRIAALAVSVVIPLAGVAGGIVGNEECRAERPSVLRGRAGSARCRRGVPARSRRRVRTRGLLRGGRRQVRRVPRSPGLSRPTCMPTAPRISGTAQSEVLLSSSPSPAPPRRRPRERSAAGSSSARSVQRFRPTEMVVERLWHDPSRCQSAERRARHRSASIVRTEG